MGEILPNVTTPKIHSMYAKARESEGRFKEACAAYMKAGEWENAIRYIRQIFSVKIFILFNLEFN